MIVYGSLICRCDECGATETFENAKGYDGWLLKLKALKAGWYLPQTGKHLCPKCHARMAQKAGMESLYNAPFASAKGIQKEFGRLDVLEGIPEPPFMENINQGA